MWKAYLLDRRLPTARPQAASSSATMRRAPPPGDDLGLDLHRPRVRREAQPCAGDVAEDLAVFGVVVVLGCSSRSRRTSMSRNSAGIAGSPCFQTVAGAWPWPTHCSSETPSLRRTVRIVSQLAARRSIAALAAALTPALPGAPTMSTARATREEEEAGQAERRAARSEHRAAARTRPFACSSRRASAPPTSSRSPARPG